MSQTTPVPTEANVTDHQGEKAIGLLSQRGSYSGVPMGPASKATESRPTSRSDRWVKRAMGIGVLVVGIAIAYSLVFTPFAQRVSFQWEFENGEMVPISRITCPSPWSVLVDESKPDGVVSGDLCVRPSRGQVIQGALALILTLGLAGWILTRDNRLRPLPELPESIRQLRRKEPN